METIDTIIQALIFIVPGFMAVEIANAMTSRQPYRRSDKERLSACLLFSFFSWVIVLSIVFLWRWHKGYFPNDLYTLIKSFPLAFFWVPMVAIFIGCLWGLWVRNKLLDSFYDLLKKWKLTDYAGPETLWDYTLRTMQTRWVEVHFKDGKVYYGNITYRSHEPQEPALYLKNVSMWYETFNKDKIERIKSEEFKLQQYAGIYLNVSDIESILFRETPKEQDQNRKPAN